MKLFFLKILPYRTWAYIFNSQIVELGQVYIKTDCAYRCFRASYNLKSLVSKKTKKIESLYIETKKGKIFFDLGRYIELRELEIL